MRSTCVATPTDEQTLEQIIDRSSVYAVLMAITRIIAWKAEHIRSNWQDEQTAKVWERTGKHLEYLALKISPFSV